MALIEFKNVDFSYLIEENDPDYKPTKTDKVLEYDGDKIEKEIKVLENLNLSIEKGSFFAVLVHNCSGK